MVPEGWEVKKFGDLFSIKSGFGFKHSEYTNMGIPLIKIDNVSHGYVKWDNISYLPYNYREEYSDILLKENDLLLALNRPITQGKLKLAKLSRNDVPSILYQRVGRIDFKTGDLERDFYLYLLDTEIFRFVSHKAIGSDQPFISTTELKKLDIAKPPVSEQRKIAKILSTWDKAITTTEKLLANNEQQKKALMQQLLTGKKRFPAFSEEWEKFELSDVFEKVTNGLTYDSKATYGLPVTRIETISTGKINYSKVGWAPKEKNTLRFKLKHGDILYSHINSLEHIGRVAFYEGELPLYHGMNLLLLRANSGFSNLFLFHLLNSHVGKKYAKIYAKSAVNQASISTRDLKSFKVRLPEIEEQQKIASVLSTADGEIETLKQKLDCLKQEKKALMQQLLTGKRRVQVN